jgi:hypothetical protein
MNRFSGSVQSSPRRAAQTIACTGARTPSCSQMDLVRLRTVRPDSRNLRPTVSIESPSANRPRRAKSCSVKLGGSGVACVTDMVTGTSLHRPPRRVLRITQQLAFRSEGS